MSETLQQACDYDRLSLVETKNGLFFFGMHNNNFYDPVNREITLKVVQEIRSGNLREIIGWIESNIMNVTHRSFSADISDDPVFELIQTAGRHYIKPPTIVLSDSITVPIEDVKCMRDLPYVDLYHARYHEPFEEREPI